jgi:carbon-monoxide dehydrogenase medium subunit
MYLNTNTRIIAPEFDFAQPKSLTEAFALMEEHGSDAKLLAGGTDLLVQMKMERISPAWVISLTKIDELNGITAGNGLSIGATTSISTVAKSAPVKADYAALTEACNAYSTVSVMLMGTIGGNICNASPAADTAPALLAFDAVAVVKSAKGSRQIPMAEFFTSPGKPALKPGEILTAIELPAPAAGSGSAFLKISRVVADISQVCVAVSLVRKGDKVTDCRIALGSVAPTPIRVASAEAALTGQTGNDAAFDKAAEIAAGDIKPITDVRASADYRRHAARIIVRDALQAAWQRAVEGAAK